MKTKCLIVIQTRTDVVNKIEEIIEEATTPGAMKLNFAVYQLLVSCDNSRLYGEQRKIDSNCCGLAL